MENMQKDIKSSRAIFWKWLPLCLATWNDHKLQYFLDDSLHLNTKIITRICSFQNCMYVSIYIYLYISQNSKKRVSTGFVRVGHIVASNLSRFPHGWMLMEYKQVPKNGVEVCFWYTNAWVIVCLWETISLVRTQWWNLIRGLPLAWWGLSGGTSSEGCR